MAEMKITPPKNSSQKSKLDTNRKPKPNWLPTKRQRGILEYIYYYGLLADRHVQWLENVSLRRAQELMKPLFDNGYINRPNPKTRARYDFMFYWLTKKGANEVADQLNVALADLDWLRYPRWGQVEHDAMVNDFHAILEFACRDHEEFELLQWINETTFRSWKDKVVYVTLSGNKSTRRMEVDCYALVKRQVPGAQKPFFARLLPELELSPKDNPRFVDHKILPGLAYLGSEIYQKRFGSRSGRWLYIVQSQDKLDGYRLKAEMALEQKDWRSFYFTTVKDIKVDSILMEPIWWRPGDRQPVPLFTSDM